MKRSISLILTLLMLFTFVMPASALEGYDKELEGVIKKAKTVFNIPDAFDKFEYHISSYSSNVEYYLRWYDSTEKAGGLEVTIDSDGMIKSYYKYNYNVQREENALPKISREQGLEIANKFLEKVVPELADKVTYVENNDPLNVRDRVHYYNYYGIVNEVPFYQNNMYVNIDNMTGEVQSFNCYWEKNIKFDTIDGIMGLEDAQKAYADKIGLKLVYKLEYRDGEMTPYTVYTSLYSSKSIDAKTGEPVSFNNYIRYANDGVATKEMAANDSVAGGVTLSPEELEAISKAKEIISKEEAEKTARQLIQISSEYKLSNINLYSVWNEKDSYTWSMYFTNKDENNISISIDAKNKELKSFYKYTPYSEKEEVKYDREQLQKKAEEFIKKVHKDKFDSVELLDVNEPIVRPLSEEKPRQQYFTFIRKAGDAYFQGNGFNLNVNGVTGEITSFDYNWYKGQLPSTAKAIGLDKAYEILFNKIGMELQYVKDNVSYDEQEREQNAKLIYAIKGDKPLNIDAFTGELLYGLNRPYKDSTVSQYTDIEDSYARTQIETLAKFGISLSGDKFSPKANIKQKEFLYLLLKAKSYYYDISDQDKDFIEKLYKYMINEKIVKENEKSPESIITKEEAAKYIVRALGYEKVANINEIYKLSFKDANKVSPELMGYVAIATGLGIVEADGDNLNPKSNMTREQAAVVLYNLLNAK